MAPWVLGEKTTAATACSSARGGNLKFGHLCIRASHQTCRSLRNRMFRQLFQTPSKNFAEVELPDVFQPRRRYGIQTGPAGHA